MRNKTHRKPGQLVYRVVLSVKEPYGVTDKLITKTLHNIYTYSIHKKRRKKTILIPIEDYTIHTLLSLSIVFQEFFRISWLENPI